MSDIFVREGDTQPLIIQQIVNDDGVPIDFTGLSVSLKIKSSGSGPIITIPCVVEDPPTSGIVSFAIVGVSPGFYLGQFSISGTSTITTAPSVPLAIHVTDSQSYEYSYTGDPSARLIDAVRFYIGDTDVSNARLTDSEITFLLVQSPNVMYAAADGANIIATQYAGFADKTVGPLSIRYSDLQSRMNSLSDSLRRRGQRNSAAQAIFTGSLIRPKIFAIGMNDYSWLEAISDE